MLITVKNIYKKEEVFEVSIDEKVSTLAELVKERFDYMNNVKLIYAGQILNLDNPISTYMNESSYGFMVCFEEKPIWNETEYCAICNFRTCIKCILKAGNLNKKCFSCRVETNNKYNIIYDLLSKFVEQ
jgi:hypothetical protein